MVTLEELCYTRAMARLATVENFCNILPTWFIQKSKRGRGAVGFMAVCPESLAKDRANDFLSPRLWSGGAYVEFGEVGTIFPPSS